ncbi:PIG-L family deacetylase [Klebsiella pneumoniae]|uniref:PIG-L family deacetylase n=1 Tax=Klebsiella quasipneumoniae TaxID=1463165 RepID=A0A8H9ZT64_9ENTR|nr:MULTISPECIES: PIG-L deacetylase family protein [Klebsiella]EKS8535626.1 PIG-L family deacetylase [Klebsiella pneumoniae]EKU5926665.1 PIG-L family deacetylase [Klebsiella pneumoniae]EKU6757279.1 PIG-L family deacetylase [Klebsiella pneumoniae]EKX0155467.1 PIG-L family deacetylase [Klebsiella pneumoniae]ELA0371253.1 PIG-L family deacetylase [Klebsiella pneumoniae]
MTFIFDAKRWLIVSPHADDAELGCGGVIAAGREKGINIHIAVASVKSENHLYRDVLTTSEVREQELIESMNFSGCSYSIFYKTDSSNEFDLASSSKSAFIKKLDSLILDFSPQVLFIPVPSFHQEHKWVYDCCMAASRPYKITKENLIILAYEYPPAGWGDSASWDSSKGAIYVDISNYIDRKIEMLTLYKSQIRSDNSSLSLKAVKTLSMYRGMQCNTDHAELFYLLRCVCKV